MGKRKDKQAKGLGRTSDRLTPEERDLLRFARDQRAVQGARRDHQMLRSERLSLRATAVAATMESMRADSVSSASTGLGIRGEDKAADAVPTPTWWLTTRQAEDLYTTDPIIRRVVDAIPSDALAPGWRTSESADGGGQDITQDLDDRLNLQRKMIELGHLSRLHGGAHLLVACRGVTDLAVPLPPGPHEIIQVVPLCAIEATVSGMYVTDMTSPQFSRPEYYTITLARPGMGGSPTMPRDGEPGERYTIGRVHWTHLVYMPGIDLPPTVTPPLLSYAMSVPQIYWDAVRDLSLARRAAALGAMEQSMPVLELPDGQTELASDDNDDPGRAYGAIIRAWTMGRSVNRANILTSGAKLSKLEAPMTGLAAILDALYAVVLAAEGIPATILLGVSPGGMSTDDASGWRTYSRLLHQWRMSRVTPVLSRLYEIAYGEGHRTIVYPPLDLPTEREQAETSRILADRDKVLIEAGIIVPSQAQARYLGEREALLPGPVPESVAPIDGTTLDGPSASGVPASEQIAEDGGGAATPGKSEDESTT